MKFNKAKALLAVIFTISVFGRAASALILGDQVLDFPGIFDQISYHTLAVRLLTGYGFTFGQTWWPITAAGQPTAHWSYLYTFYLAAVYGVFGIHPLAARLIQAVITGILTPWLIYRLSGRVFQNLLSAQSAQALGLIAAFWSAVYGYFAYYGGALMTEPFYIVGLLWIMDTTLRIGEQRSWRWFQFLELGAAIALTALLRQVFLLFIPFLFLWLLWRRLGTEKFWEAVGQVVKGGAIVVCVCVILFGPITAFNYQRFGRFVLLNTNDGYAFFWANHPIYGDHFEPILESRHGVSYQELIPQELRGLNEAALNQALLQRGIGFVLDDPGRYIRLSISRIPVFFEFWPSSDSGTLSNIVRVASFGLALPFMLMGLGLWMRDGYRFSRMEITRSPGAFVLLFMLIYSAIHILSWALIRYRLPVDAFGLIFASRGILLLTARFQPRS